MLLTTVADDEVPLADNSLRFPAPVFQPPKAPRTRFNGKWCKWWRCLSIDERLFRLVDRRLISVSADEGVH